MTCNLAGNSPDRLKISLSIERAWMIRSNKYPWTPIQFLSNFTIKWSTERISNTKYILLNMSISGTVATVVGITFAHIVLGIWTRDWIRNCRQRCARNRNVCKRGPRNFPSLYHRTTATPKPRSLRLQLQLQNVATASPTQYKFLRHIQPNADTSTETQRQLVRFLIFRR